MTEDDLICEINMTPLIDIMLVLLILLMVSSSLSSEGHLPIHLPEMKQGPSSVQRKAVVLGLGPRGEMFVQGHPVTSEGLRAAIKLALEKHKTRFVILEGDRQSRLGEAIKLMDAARAAGAQDFALAGE